MEIDKSILVQKQIKDNSEDLQNEFRDIKNWAEQMKRKDQELRAHNSNSVLPPIRSKKKKIVQISDIKKQPGTTNTKRIKSHDYAAWDKFDVDKACEEIEKSESSNDSEEEISKEELTKNHEEATKQKEKGNIYAQQQNWDKAITCYNAAIKIFPYDAIFYANRALCHLKMDNPYSAEADCSAAIQLDETYVKAYYRRATIRIELKQYKEAKQDVEKILKLEPSNKNAKALLIETDQKLASLERSITPKQDTNEELSFEKKIGEKLWNNQKTKGKINDTKCKKDKVKTIIDKEPSTDTSEEKKGRYFQIPDWLPEKDNVEIVEPIVKPPHLRSKKPMKKIIIEEADFSMMKYNKQNVENANEYSKQKKSELHNNIIEENNSNKVTETITTTDEIPRVPKTAIQFYMDWQKYKSSEFCYKYLKQIPSYNLSIIFKDSMEVNILSDIITILKTEFLQRNEPVFEFLIHLSHVNRFSILMMFITDTDKQNLKIILEYCKTNEDISREEIGYLYNIYRMQHLI